MSEEWVQLSEYAPIEGKKIEVCFFQEPAREGEEGKWIHNIRTTVDHLHRDKNWYWRYTYPPEKRDA